MLRISNLTSRRFTTHVLLVISMLISMLGALSLPSPGMADTGTDPLITLSSANAPACSGDNEASCLTASFKADMTHTASYVFDCSGDSIDLPLLTWFLQLLGVPLSLFEKLIIPGVPTPLCTLFAQGSTLGITERTPNGTYTTLVEKSYSGGKHEGTFTAQANYTYEISLTAHGRDFRDALQANNLGTFDSFANITYQEIDPNDDLCRNAIPFNLPYSGNLEFSGDHDWQRIQSLVKGTMVLTLDVPAGKDYQVEVWNDACSAIWVGTPHGPGEDETIEVPVDWGYYRVHVFGKTSTDFNGWYGVSASFSGDLGDNECTNAAQFNLPYNGNLEYTGDHDWQRIQSPVKGTMVLTLDVPPDKDYQLEVWNDACSAIWVLSQNGTGVDEQFIMPVDQASYRVHVFGKTTADFGAWYSVSALWDMDDNQWENAAPFNPPFQGNLEYSGDQDWQKITVPAGGTTLVLDVPDGKNYEFELWRDDVKTKLAESKNSSSMDEFILIAQPGAYRIHIYGMNPAMDFNASYGVSLIVDNIAPVSAVALSGTAGTNGWFRSNVQVTLNATDNPGGSGVQKIEYGFNYTPWNPFTGPWIVYSNPFTINTEGHTYLEFRSTDNAGNVESNQSQVIRIDTIEPEISGSISPPTPNLNGWYNTNVTVGFSATDFQSGIASLIPFEKTITSEGAGQSMTGTAVDNAGNSKSLTMGNISIDKTAPTLTLLSPQATAYTRSASLTIAWNASDSLSGIQSSLATLDGQPVVNGQGIDLYALSLGPHTLKLQSKDMADNTASLSVIFTLTADINSLQDAISHVYDLRWINKEGVYASLNTSLEAAQASMARNQLNAARNQLMALLNKLDAQKGKAINQQAYDLLKADVLYVLNRLPQK